MRSTFKVLFFLKRDKVKANGTVPLYCRITVDGQEARFGMKCDVNPKYWEVKSGKATGRTTEAAKINTLVDDTKAAITKVYRELQERDNYVTAEKIKNVFLGIEQKHQTLLELFDDHNRERKLQIGVSYAKCTYNAYCYARERLADFISYKYNLNDIAVKEVNKQFIGDFETYLLSQRQCSKNYAVGIMKKLRHIIELALNREWIYRNPFKEHKLQWQKVDRGYLTQSEIETLMDAQFDERVLEVARDIFIFCVFTGLAYTDVKHLTNENIQTSFDGKQWIKGKRQKTNTDYNVPLMNIPKTIIEKYSGKVTRKKASRGFLLPVCYLTDYNFRLKKVASQCGITKNMSSHLARHTFATLTLTKGVSIESVSKMLGHTNIATTQTYARITDKKLGNEMSMFAGNVKKMDIIFHTASIEELKIEDVFQSLKIRTGKKSDKVWETLTAKVWDKMTVVERQSFVSEMDNKENKPKTMGDFYAVLIDYFLKNLNSQNEAENVFSETKLAANF